MSQQEIIDAIQRIKQSQENFVVFIGITIGVILVLYFFSFAALVDSPSHGLVWFQALSTIAMVLALVFLKRIGFFFARLRLGRQPQCKQIFDNIRAPDLSLDEATLAMQIQQNSQNS